MDDSILKLECPICLDKYKTPILITCGHSFCMNCVEGVAQNQHNFQCPVCRQIVTVPFGGVGRFPRNFALETTTDTQATVKVNQKCSTHGNKDVDSFCRKCNIGVCSLCILKDHKDHRYVILEDSQEEVLKEFIDKRDNLKDEAQMIHNNQETLALSLEKFDQLEEAVNDDITVEVMKHFGSNRDKMTQMICKLSERHDKLQNSLDKPYEEGNTLELLKSISSLESLQKELQTNQVIMPEIQYLVFEKSNELPEYQKRLGSLRFVPFHVPGLQITTDKTPPTSEPPAGITSEKVGRSNSRFSSCNSNPWNIRDWEREDRNERKSFERGRSYDRRPYGGQRGRPFSRRGRNGNQNDFDLRERIEYRHIDNGRERRRSRERSNTHDRNRDRRDHRERSRSRRRSPHKLDESRNRGRDHNQNNHHRRKDNHRGSSERGMNSQINLVSHVDTNRQPTFMVATESTTGSILPVPLEIQANVQQQLSSLRPGPVSLNETGSLLANEVAPATSIEQSIETQLDLNHSESTFSMTDNYNNSGITEQNETAPSQMMLDSDTSLDTASDYEIDNLDLVDNLGDDNFDVVDNLDDDNIDVVVGDGNSGAEGVGHGTNGDEKSEGEITDSDD